MILAKTRVGIRFNGHMEGDGETVFRHACKLGLEGIVSGLSVPFRPLVRLAQNEERRCTCDEARNRGRLGKEALAMSVAPEGGRTAS
jgi:hypothetical protein